LGGWHLTFLGLIGLQYFQAGETGSFQEPTDEESQYDNGIAIAVEIPTVVMTKH